MGLKRPTDSNAPSASSVVAPRTENPRADDIQLWEKTPHGDIWKGFFKDATTALDWVREHPGNFTLNNVPPSTSNAFHQPVRGDVQPSESPAKPVARATKRSFMPSPRRKVKATITSYKPKTKEESVLVNAAKDLLSEHKQAEEADLKKGKVV